MDRKRKKLLIRLVIAALILIAVAALVYLFWQIYKPTEEQNYNGEAEILYYEDEGKKAYTMENEQLKFEMDPETTHFKLTEKKTGKVWYSNPQKWADDKLAPIQKNREFLASTLSVVYSSFGADIEWNNYTYSIQNKNYAIEQPDDSSIRVKYTIGQIERVYQIPQAISEERFNAFSTAMGKKNSKLVGKMYSKKDPSKLKDSEKEELLAQYPGLANGTIYVMKSDLSIKQKGDLEGYFADANYTAEDLEIDNMNLVQSEQKVNGPVFNIDIVYSLDKETGDFIVKVPYESIRCSADEPLVAVSVLPMFGAADLETDGFIFVPEGGGSIIRYNNHKIKQATYVTNLYGMDYAKMAEEAKTENRTALPVFGMGQEDGSFICIIEEGDAFASITADISEKISSYNEVYAKYSVIHYDKFKVTGASNNPFYMYEVKIPDCVITQRYRFTDGNDYVAMAHSFRSYLLERYADVLTGDKVGTEIPVNVELVGAINKTVPKAGLPVDSVIPVTTFEQAGEIMDELLSNGVKDLSVRMTGWSNGGVNQTVLTKVSTESVLGGNKGMKSLIAKAKDNGVDLYFDGITCFAYDSNLFDGFIPYMHAARFTTREQVELWSFDIVTFQRSTWMDKFYLVKPSYAAQCAENLIENLAENGAAGVAFRDIGRLLSADYYHRDTVTREEVKQMNVETLRSALDKGLKVSVKAGNLYAVPYADLITDMELSGNSYAILDEDVPFYQIVLHGLKDYTGEPINMAGDWKTALLECAEFGSGLNFTFMKADTILLQDSAYSCYTSAGYDRWKDEVIPVIIEFQNTMEGLNGVSIIGHRNLREQLTATYYEDGSCVYVNYSNFDREVDGVSVPARSYVRTVTEMPEDTMFDEALPETDDAEAVLQEGGNEA